LFTISFESYLLLFTILLESYLLLFIIIYSYRLILLHNNTTTHIEKFCL